MVADIESQNIPLVERKEMESLNADNVWKHLKEDNESSLQQLLNQGNLAAVLRPRTSAPSADTATALHVAAEHGAEKCLRLLLSHRPTREDLEAPDIEGKTALLVAVSTAQPAVLRYLLQADANINARDDNRRSALHLLVLELSKEKTEEQQRRLQEVADLLLSPEHVNKLDLEPHAFMAFLTSATPLAVAAAKLRRADDGMPWVPGLLTLCEKLVLAGASLSENAGGGATVEQVLTGKGCLTQELLQRRRQPPQRPTGSHVVDVVSLDGGGGEVRNVLEGKSQEEAHKAVNSRLGKHSLLWYAVDNGNSSLVEALLHHGANTWAPEVSSNSTGKLPLHCAAYVGNVCIFTQIVDKMKGSDNIILDLRDHTTSLVRDLLLKGHSKMGSQDADHMACLRRLLEKDVKLDMNQRDMEQTALHVAASLNNQEGVGEVLRSGGFLGAQREVLGKRCGTVLDSVLPGTLELAMDGCITHHQEGSSGAGGDDAYENVLSEDYTLHLDYRFLLPPQQEPEPVNEMETLMEVCRSRRHRHAILHPLVQTLLYAKWRKALPLYLFNVLVYLFFVIVLTTFVYYLKDLRVLEARLGRMELNGTVDTAGVEGEVAGQQGTVYLLMALLLIAWLFMLVREVFQIISFKWSYLKSIDNYLEWILLVAVVVLCAVNLGVDGTRHVGAWAMIVAWYEFVLVLGRQPRLALYITMLRRVSWNFLKLIFLFSALILAFTISFSIILQATGDDEGEDFSHFLTTLPKTIVMSTGEFEYSDLSGKFPKTWLMISAVLVFLVFLFLIFLVLMNVMNGLAVSDTQQAVEDATLCSLTSRLELVYLVEALLLYCPCLRSLIGVQLLSRPDNVPSLLVKINNPKKSERLRSGSTHQIKSKLDDETTECLKVHRLQYLEELSKQQRDDNAAQLNAAVQDLKTQYQQDLKTQYQNLSDDSTAKLDAAVQDLKTQFQDLERSLVATLHSVL